MTAEKIDVGACEDCGALMSIIFIDDDPHCYCDECGEIYQ